MKVKKRGLKRGEIETRKLVQAIIVLVVIVVIIMAFASQAKAGSISKFLKFIPDFIKPNYTVSPPVQCPIGYVEVGYIDKSNYIILNGKKTNLYYQNGNMFISIPFNYDFGRDQLLGYVDKGIILINFPENLDEREIEFRRLFPEEKEKRFLLEANIFEGTICLSNDKYKNFEEKDKCVLTCAILNGICSSSAVNGKIIFKKLNCPNGQLCYVSETEKIFDSENIHIKKESFFESLIDLNDIAKKTLNNIFDSDKFSVTISDKIRLVILMKHTEPFCYSFDVDNEETKLFNGYADRKDDSYALRSGVISYSGEKILSYAAWNNEKNERVFVKWKLESRGMGNQYEDGQIIKDSEFAWKLQNVPIGSIFYVIGLKREWDIGYFWNRKGNLLVTYDYKVEKNSDNKIFIYAHDREKKVWHKLYCNKNSMVNWWLGYSMKITKDIPNSLSETIDKNCMWSF